MQFATLASDTPYRLALGSLFRGPLRLLVSGRTGIGAHSAMGALVTGDSCDNIGDSLTNDVYILNTRPTLQAKVIECQGTVIGGESVAVQLAVREFPLDSFENGGAAWRGRSSSRG